MTDEENGIETWVVRGRNVRVAPDHFYIEDLRSGEGIVATRLTGLLGMIACGLVIQAFVATLAYLGFGTLVMTHRIEYGFLFGPAIITAIIVLAYVVCTMRLPWKALVAIDFWG